MKKKDITVKTKSGIISQKGVQRLIDFIESRHYEAYPETPIDCHTEITDGMIDYLLNKYPLVKDAEILDVGCGQGPALRKFTETECNVTGITLNKEDFEICKSQNFNVHKMDQSFIDFADNSFDLIWARHVLEHSLFPMFTLNEFIRLLKPDGRLYVEVPLPGLAYYHERNPNHYSIFNADTWVEVFRKMKLEIIEDRVIDVTDHSINEIVDQYVAFFLKPTSELKQKNNPLVYLALSKGENFGWGVCSKYINQEFSKIYQNTKKWDFEQNPEEMKIEGKILHTLTDLDFNPISKIRGTENFGYTFFENELTETSIKNSKNYDLVLAGSSWCEKKMQEIGINNTGLLIQGIDPEIFYPIEESKEEDIFVIFSGGKFEYRKGQDIVLKAVKVLQEKYENIVLMNAWFNMWPQSMTDMKYSKHIDMSLSGNNWTELMQSLYKNNNMQVDKIFTFELIKNTQLRDLYAKTDLGLFPNRCEGGTNLVLMEYMACGKPVIASNATGHKDILTAENSIMLNHFTECKIEKEGKFWADWAEPSLDEVIFQLEYAYNNRDYIKQTGKHGAEHLKKFTWEETAKSLYKTIM